MAPDQVRLATDLLSCMRAERERARRAAEVAARHEKLAGQGPLLRGLSLRMAAIHRRMEQRHLVTLDLYAFFLRTLRQAEAWGPGQRATPPSLMSAAARLSGSTGAIMALTDSRQREAMVVASDDLAREVHDLESQAGQGPSRDAVHGRRPVTVAGRELSERWSLYGPAAAELNVQAVAAVPLGLGATCIGALTLLNPPPSAPATIGVLSEALTCSLIDGQLAGSQDLAPAEYDLVAVHQATGMVAARQDCSVEDALAMMRARAFADGTTLRTVADGVRGGDLDLR